MTEKGPAPSRLAATATAVLLAAVVLVLTGLGVWQIQRRTWKHDLIARVQARIHAAPQPSPGPALWPRINPADDEYRVVRLSGRYGSGRDTLVQAVTVLGGGYWVLTPLKTDAGWTVLVNRGFVPVDWRSALHAGIAPPQGPVTITGLLRLSEPGGGFLRRNRSAENRWYSRDVAAIARARHLGAVAPYFVDVRRPGVWPRPGLTVLDFPDNHLVYAITWFGLAALIAGLSLRAWLGGGRR